MDILQMNLLYKCRWASAFVTCVGALGSSGNEKKRAREKGTRVSPSRAPALSFTHYFQAPVTQASAFGNVELLGNAALHDNCLLIYVVCRVL